jgi:ribosomal protein L11 methylase PrmA
MLIHPSDYFLQERHGKIMKWTKFTLDTTTEAVDLISDMLNDLGIEGNEVSDKSSFVGGG